MEEYLRSLFRNKNPYERNIETTKSLIGSSGYAAPFLAAMMGRDVASAEEWEAERDKTARDVAVGGLGLQKDKQDQEFALHMIGKWIELAKEDSVAANMFSEAAVKNNPTNPYMKDFAGIKILNKMTKDGVVPIQDGTGQQYLVNLGVMFSGNEMDVGEVKNFKERSQSMGYQMEGIGTSAGGDNEKNERRGIFKIGSPKPPEEKITTLGPGQKAFKGESGIPFASVDEKTPEEKITTLGPGQKAFKGESSIPFASVDEKTPEDKRTADVVAKDIRDLQIKLMNYYGNTDFVEAIVMGNLSPEARKKLEMDKNNNPFVKEVVNSLDILKEEYQNKAGKKYSPSVEARASDKGKQGSDILATAQLIPGERKIKLQDGRIIPLDENDIVTIDGKKLKFNLPEAKGDELTINNVFGRTAASGVGGAIESSKKESIPPIREGQNINVPKGKISTDGLFVNLQGKDYPIEPEGTIRYEGMVMDVYVEGKRYVPPKPHPEPESVVANAIRGALSIEGKMPANILSADRLKELGVLSKDGLYLKVEGKSYPILPDGTIAGGGKMRAITVMGKNGKPENYIPPVVIRPPKKVNPKKGLNMKYLDKDTIEYKGKQYKVKSEGGIHYIETDEGTIRIGEAKYFIGGKEIFYDKAKRKVIVDGKEYAVDEEGKFEMNGKSYEMSE